MESFDRVSKKKDVPAAASPAGGKADPDAPLEAPLEMQVAILAYVAGSMIVDTLAGYEVDFILDWSTFMWQSPLGADFFKFLMWFVLPLALCWPLDRGWFSIGRWKKVDFGILAVIMLVGGLAMLIIPKVESLQAMYGGMVDMARGDVPNFVLVYLCWTVSWLPGWELIHRYWMLRAFGADIRKLRWLLIPVYEGLYHLQKPPLEMLGMVVFSLVLTSWAIRRQNVLLPFIAHLLIELDLLAFLMYAATHP